MRLRLIAHVLPEIALKLRLIALYAGIALKLRLIALYAGIALKLRLIAPISQRFALKFSLIACVSPEIASKSFLIAPTYNCAADLLWEKVAQELISIKKSK